MYILIKHMVDYMYIYIYIYICIYIYIYMYILIKHMIDIDMCFLYLSHTCVCSVFKLVIVLYFDDCRHEMQHFVKVMQGYIANQVTHVTWQEFQRDLRDNVKNLDDLHHRHAEYLNKTVFR